MIPIRGLRACYDPTFRPAADPDDFDVVDAPEDASATGRKRRTADTWFKWTPQAEARLRELWAAGRSAKAIADELGKPATKSAVLGKARRLQLPKREVPAGFRTKETV